MRQGSSIKIYSDTHKVKVTDGKYQIKEYGGSYRDLHDPDSYIAHLVGTSDHPHHNSEKFLSNKQESEFEIPKEQKITSYNVIPSETISFKTADGSQHDNINDFIRKYLKTWILVAMMTIKN